VTATRLSDSTDAPVLLEVARADRDFLAPWEPQRDERWSTLDGRREEIAAGQEQHHLGLGVPLVVLDDAGAVMATAFGELGLHRVEAATLVHDAASQRVLGHTGSTRYGLAPGYLRIAGRWQDHVPFRLLDPAAP
jgi:ribosomal-protein-alanine N-acetyltransferase